MTPQRLAELVTDVLEGALAPGTRWDVPVLVTPVGEPHDGDLTTNVLPVVASRLGLDVAELAADVAAGLAGAPGVSAVTVERNGLLDVQLTAESLWGTVSAAVRAPAAAPLRTELPGRWAELADRVGEDTARLCRALDPRQDPGRLAGDTLLTRRVGNPVFRVSYAYARAAAILAAAERIGADRPSRPAPPMPPGTPGRRLLVAVADLAGPTLRAGAGEPERGIARRVLALADRYLAAGGDRALPPGGAVSADQAVLIRASAATRRLLGDGSARLGVELPDRI